MRERQSALVLTVLISAASYRMWRLIAIDTITKSLRERIFSEARREKHLYEYARLWLKCPWCAGTWITAAFTLVTARRLKGRMELPLLIFAAASAGTGLLGTYDPDHQQQQMEGGE